MEDRYDSWWFSDHFIPWPAVGRTVPSQETQNDRFQSPDTDTFECWTTLSHMSAEFKNIDLGSIVVGNSFRNPALLAKMSATLSVLTGGRFILGIGAGWNKDEFLAYGYEFPKTAVRVQRLEEGIQIIKKMWSEERTTFKGEHYQVEAAYCNPRPEPPPPIMIGGSGEKYTLRVVAKYADWWNTYIGIDDYQHKLQVLQRHCDEVGRDFGEIKKTLGGMYVAIGETEEEAERIASNSQFITDGNKPYSFIGTPDTLVDRIHRYKEIGVEYIILRFEDFPSTKGATLFADEVIPKIN